MDKNKAQKLRDVGYRINPACSLCAFGRFPQNDWGTCAAATYFHNKHQESRQMSIHKAGSCPNFQPAYSKLISVVHYKEFFTFKTGGWYANPKGN